MKDLGIAVVTMYFSGFWSQGDGASFKGRIDDLALFIQKHNIEAPTILSLLSEDSIAASFRSSVSGHYSHSGCMSFEHELQFTGPDYDEPLLQAAATIKNDLAEKEWDKLVSDLAPGIFRGYANELYRSLEQEYEYLTSDEQVLELLISNGLLEEEVERYELDCGEEGDEGTDSDALQELLLRPLGAVPDSSGATGHPDAGD